MRKLFLLILVTMLMFVSCSKCKDGTAKSDKDTIAVKAVFERLTGRDITKYFILETEISKAHADHYSISKAGDRIRVTGNSRLALCRGVYDYLKNHCNSIISWSGNKIDIPESLPEADKKIYSPYRWRYYFNVVTHGYSTAYWDWKRWEKELDWMAVHGINMPLIPGAHEAVLYRVFKKIGLKDEEIRGYFSGPAHFPWNRMGNLEGWDGHFPEGYFKKQLELTHMILDRMKTLGMTPIVHAFAGFVPEAVKRIDKSAEIKELGWGGGLKKKYNAFILSPDSELFIKIGKMYIEEWEKEFGKGRYYLADSFNEMDVPVSDDQEKMLKELAKYGESVYRSVKEGNPDATWVMQGWTFPFHRGKDGKRFWTKERLGALVSKVPDDKLLILDLANEYNRVFWKIDPSWKIYEGFFNKKWIYSFIPNMGGKVPLNGRLDIYASIPVEALKYKNRKRLVGFGFAPEGIENNEIIYELLADMAWRSEKIDLNRWIEKYCIQRYGAYPDKMKLAYELLNRSALGSFTDHPMHRYQLRPYKRPPGVERRATVHKSEIFNKAVGEFLAAAPVLKNSKLYLYDAIELTVQYLGLVADEKILEFLDKKEKEDLPFPEEIRDILLAMDRLLESHPNHRLDRWVEFARGWGENGSEKDYYESNAKRLLTTWGGDPVNDYSGRVWCGLIRDYYLPRWIAYHDDKGDRKEENMRKWEERWITTPGITKIEPYKDPLKIAAEYYNKYKP